MTSIGIEAAQSDAQLVVVIRDVEPLANRFELPQGRLAQFILEGGVTIAAEDSAAGEAMFVHGAPLSLLIGTSPAGHCLQAFAVELRGQIDQLRRRDEQSMVVGDEIAAGAASLTAPGAVGVPTLLEVDPVVDGRYGVDESAASFGLSHHLLLFLIFSICSKL